MPTVNRQTMIFSLNSFVAAMLALYIAFTLGLERPYWAMLTIYITSQPLAGAVRSKAVYRLIGTLIGAAMSVALVPNLVNTPLLLSFAIAFWVALCLVISLLDRTPRSYMMMLSGYTVAIIGFGSVNAPGVIFDIAVSRAEEIGLGIICAALTHSLFFPRDVGQVIELRLSQWLDSADRWLLDLIQGEGPAESARDRRHLAAAASEIRTLATHLPFDTSRLRETGAAVQAIHERMLFLIALLSGVSDRLQALAAGEPTPPVRARLEEVGAWLQAAAQHEAGLALATALRADAMARAGGDWHDLLIESLLVRMSEAVTALDESHGILRHLKAPDSPVPAEIASAIAGAVKRPLHRDAGLALRSGATAVVAVMITCVLWVGTGWLEGAAAAAMCAIACALFAALDDPAPAIRGFGIFSLLGVAIAMVYEFAIFEAIDGFAMLAAALFPLMFVGGLYLANPRTSGMALGGLLGFFGALALQETLDPNFAAFLNSNLAQYVGLVIAIVIVRAMRSLTAEASVQRLLRLTWSAIASLAGRGAAQDPAHFAAVMVDRLALLTPRLALREESGDALAEDALRDLRVAMNVMTVQQADTGLAPLDRTHVHGLMAALQAHYAGLARNAARHAPMALLELIDTALRGLGQVREPAERSAALGLVGLRRNLFPAAAPFVATQEHAQ